MLPADFEEFLASKERDIKRPPAPPKRRQPKVTRMTPQGTRIAEKQTRNPIKAIYGAENQFNATPIKADTSDLTTEVGPHDQYGAGPNFRTGMPTQGTPVGYNKVKPRRGRPSSTSSTGSPRKSNGRTDYDALAKLFE